jgi:hypothetical protein
MKNLINKTLVSSAGLEAVMLRVPIGLILAAHAAKNYSLGLAVTDWKEQGNGWHRWV